MSVTEFAEFVDRERSDYACLRDAFQGVTDSWESLTRGQDTVDALCDSLELADEADLLDLAQAFGRLQRQVAGQVAQLANEIATRSAPERGEAAMARRNGCRDAADLLAEVLGCEKREADTYVRVGRDVVAPRWLLSGDRGQARAPFVSRALAEGQIGISYANDVVKLRRRMEPRVLEEELVEGEREVVEVAKSGMRLPDFRKVVARLEAQLDPNGLEPSFRKQRRDRAVTISTDPDSGMLRIKALVDPESGMYVSKFFEAYCTNAIRTSRGGNVKGQDPELPTDGELAGSSVFFRPTDNEVEPVAVAVDTRSVPQMRADALVEACKHLLGCAQDEVPGVTTTVLLRMHVEDLRVRPSGKGEAAESEGGVMLDAGALRRRAATAGIIPIVLGGDSEVLDLGREYRHFTRAQRTALVERDGGCAFCGLPPGVTEAHHIDWWRAHDGKTDLDNAVLLCTTCHHRVHEGWQIRVAHEPAPPGEAKRAKSRGGGTVWFIPPEDVDWQQTPRLGGRKRFDVGYRQAYPPTPLPEAVGRTG